MISLDQYFGQYASHPDAGIGMWHNAENLLDRVNSLLSEYQDATGKEPPIDEDTNSQISGNGNGGFRPRNCPVGSPSSSHKEGRGVDIKDPSNLLDDWITDDILKQFNLYREHPSATDGWIHLTDRAPPSGKRTFAP